MEGQEFGVIDSRAMYRGDFEHIDWFHPSTWPVFFWIWLAFALFGPAKSLWTWWRKREAESWPSVAGTIDTAQVEENKSFWQTKKNEKQFRANIYYTYVINGERYSRKYWRVVDEVDGQELTQGLGGRTISVHVNPNDSGKSFVSDEEIDRVAEERGPAAGLPAPDASPYLWMRSIAWPLAALSLIGLVISVWAHLNAIVHKRVINESEMNILFFGIFIVFVPSVFMMAAAKKARNWKRFMEDHRGAKLIFSIMGGYAVFNYFYCLSLGGSSSLGGDANVATIRLFSGHAMVFYAAALGMNYALATLGSDMRAGA